MTTTKCPDCGATDHNRLCPTCRARKQSQLVQPCALPQHRGQSGATSSELRPAYADAPRSFWRRLGLRFSLGAKLHQRGNWLRSFGIDGRPWDVDYLRDRYNHAIDHLLAFKEEGSTPDDHLAAVAWFCAYAMQAEDLGLDWPSILRVRTPEEEQARAEPKAKVEVRAWTPGHACIIAAAVLLQKHNGSDWALVVRRAPGRKLAGAWEFPGGKVEPGEQYYGTLQREMREELGIDLPKDASRLPNRYDYDYAGQDGLGRTEIYVYLIRRWTHVSAEGLGLSPNWANKAEAPNYVNARLASEFALNNEADCAAWVSVRDLPRLNLVGGDRLIAEELAAGVLTI